MINRQEQIASEMASLRLAGAASAERLPAAWNRAKDWREYVRAFPLQSVAAAAIVGFTVVPKRKADDERQLPPLDRPFRGNRQDERLAEPAKPQSGFVRSLVAPVKPWAVAFATQAIHRMVMKQFDVLSTRIFTDERQSDHENHATSGFEHVAGNTRQNPGPVDRRNGHYNGNRRSDP
ncbi:MAG TPA: hypothetical protein DDZ51_05135 [Planctomycetaceae bacterium]|nr:hypothetical protein [Planctomycetaceae bacterium]